MSAPEEETEAAEAAEAVAAEAAGDGEAAGDEAAAGGEAAGDEAAEAVTEDAEDAEAAEDSGDSEDAEAVTEDAEDSEGAEDGPNLFDAIKEEVTELRDRYARLQAEWDNYRKRTEAARAEERVRAAEGLVTDLLPVLDDLERAIAHARDTGAAADAEDGEDASARAAGADATGLVEGVEAIQGKLLSILGKHEVTQIEALGQPFDAQRHQAVSVREDDTVDEETVVEVLQQGYMMGERVIRPAMVVTSTK